MRPSSSSMVFGADLQDPPLAPGGNVSYVCLGDEWHRFPSSFHLPAPAYRLAFVKSGFRGLLPRPFDLQQVLAYLCYRFKQLRHGAVGSHCLHAVHDAEHSTNRLFSCCGCGGQEPTFSCVFAIPAS